VAEGRGKKAKKPRWQMVLGLKQVLCGALGLTWMMVIIFILGVLAGRGDIYRWLSGWGLLTMEAPRVAQWAPPAGALPGAPGAKSLPAAPGAAVTPTTPPPAPTASAAPHPPVTGSLTISPASPSTAAKKSKRGASLREQKAKEEELRRLRREVAKKLKFQNSFDSSPSKPGRGTLKLKEKPSAAAKAPSTKSRVARLRDAQAAKAKMAELQKKGEKVTLKTGKDQKGAYYDLFRQAPAGSREADGLAQKTKKSSRNKPKSQTKTSN
jgi:hypothetical protein